MCRYFSFVYIEYSNVKLSMLNIYDILTLIQSDLNFEHNYNLSFVEERKKLY